MNTDANIPLLTDIIQLGDTEMENHFDGHALNEDDTDVANDEAFNTALENFDINTDEGNDIPAISLEQNTFTDIDDIKIDLPDNIQTDDLNVEVVEPLITPVTDAIPNNIDNEDDKSVLQKMSRDELNKMINLLVSDAVDSTLPIIEAQLKQSLSEQIMQKLSRQID